MLICISKINFIIHFFLKILQRNSKLVILGNLSMAGYTYMPKMMVTLRRTFDVYQLAKKSTSLFTFSLRYWKDMQTYLRMPGYTHPKWQCIDLLNTSIFNCMLKMNFILHFFLKILNFKEFCNLIDWQHCGP